MQFERCDNCNGDNGGATMTPTSGTGSVSLIGTATATVVTSTSGAEAVAVTGTSTPTITVPVSGTGTLSVVGSLSVLPPGTVPVVFEAIARSATVTALDRVTSGVAMSRTLTAVAEAQ